jgi:serine protease Do
MRHGNRSLRRLWAGTALWVGLVAAVAAQADSLPDFRSLVKQNQAAVVNISTTQKSRLPQLADLPPGYDQLPEGPWRDFFKRFGQQAPQERETHSLGSGFVISADGKILTNAHVVDGAESIVVKLADRSEKAAKVIGVDKATDVALLEIDAKNLPTVKLGDSSKLEVGEWVIAIGSPFGLEHTATQGIVSALGRSLPDGTYVPFIQTDVAVNPGNSGGPLFNTRGEVVGINSQIYSRTGGFMGLSFAIPINVASNVAQQLKEHGHVTRGWLGIQIQGMSAELAQSFGLTAPSGALVASVDPKGPASAAGLKPGDVILTYDGKDIAEASSLPPLVGETQIGRKVEIKIWRDKQPLTLSMRVAALKNEDKTDAANEREPAEKATLNLMVTEVPAELRERFDLKKGGALVSEVHPGPAERAGVQAGDVILKLGDQDVAGPADVAKIVKGLPREKPIALLVQREQGRTYLAMTLPAEGAKK